MVKSSAKNPTVVNNKFTLYCKPKGNVGRYLAATLLGEHLGENDLQLKFMVTDTTDVTLAGYFKFIVQFIQLFDGINSIEEAEFNVTFKRLTAEEDTFAIDNISNK